MAKNRSSQKKSLNWTIEEEFDKLRETVDEYYDMIEELVEAYDSISVDLEDMEEIDLYEALERIRKYYEGQS